MLSNCCNYITQTGYLVKVGWMLSDLITQRLLTWWNWGGCWMTVVIMSHKDLLPSETGVDVKWLISHKDRLPSETGVVAKWLLYFFHTKTGCLVKLGGLSSDLYHTKTGCLVKLGWLLSDCCNYVTQRPVTWWNWGGCWATYITQTGCLAELVWLLSNCCNYITKGPVAWCNCSIVEWLS